MTPSTREAHGRMTRQELGDLVGVSAEMIAKIEQGLKPPPVQRLRAIADAFGIDPLELSDRGAMWATVMTTTAASQAALRRIASGNLPAVGAGAGFLRMVPAPGVPVMGAAMLGKVAAFRDEQQGLWIEAALRQHLDMRIEEASTRRDLEDLEAQLSQLEREVQAAIEALQAKKRAPEMK